MVFGVSADLASNILARCNSARIYNKAEGKSSFGNQKPNKITETKQGALRVSVGSNLTYNPIIQQSVIEFGGQKTVVKCSKRGLLIFLVTVNQALFDQTVFIGLKAAKIYQRVLCP